MQLLRVFGESAPPSSRGAYVDMTTTHGIGDDDLVRLFYPDLWTTQQVSDYTQIPVRTLEDWRSARAVVDGPPFLRLGRRKVRYRRDDVINWLNACFVGVPVAVSR